MSYRIKRVALLTGINPATLRAWERRYGLVAPRRTRSGYRMYSDEDVALLSRLKSLVDEGLSIGEAATRVGRGTASAPGGGSAAAPPRVRAALIRTLLSLDRRGALEAWAPAARLPAERRVDEVLLPLMDEIGSLWERGGAGVCEEHFASAFVREKLAGILEDLDTGAGRGPEAVCAGVPGERHEFGLMAAAVHLAVRGWRIVYLGVDLPFDELRRVLHERRPALHCTSVVTRMERKEFERLARALRDLAPPETEVVVGGRGIPDGVQVEGVRIVAEMSRLVPAAAA